MNNSNKWDNLKPGDIVIRLEPVDRWSKKSVIGKMYKIHRSRNCHVEYSGGWRMLHSACRPATEEETQAYVDGCRHIKDLDKYKKEIYAIY